MPYPGSRGDLMEENSAIDSSNRRYEKFPAFTVHAAQETNRQIITPEHPGLYYIGRIDRKDPGAPRFIWQGTELRFSFSGRRLGLRFSDAWGQNFYNVIIDGRVILLQLVEGGSHDYLLDEILPEGWHEVIIFKRTEAMFSNAVFRGLILERGTEMGSKPEPLPLAIEFYGDSISAGACNEDPAADQYDDYSTHNNYRSYGAMTARNLNAEYVNIAVSGTGICYSWNPVLMPEVYDKLYPENTSERYDFSGRIPDIVLLNLGQNDYGYPNSLGKPFPSDFTEKYTELVRNLRGLYPDARIICAIGGMSAYRESPDLQAAFKKAVDILKSADERIYSFVFTAYTDNHPRVDTHAKLAAELTPLIQKVVLPE